MQFYRGLKPPRVAGSMIHRLRVVQFYRGLKPARVSDLRKRRLRVVQFYRGLKLEVDEETDLLV